MRHIWWEDLDHVAEHMRQLDRDEVLAANGRTDLRELLAQSIEHSHLAWTLEIDGEPAAIIGVVPMADSTGAPWMLGTDLVTQHPRDLWLHSRPTLAYVREHYLRLHNYVDARNKPSIRWLRRLGFTIHPPVAWGVAGMPFRPFILENSSCA